MVALAARPKRSPPITDKEELRRIEALCSEVGALLRAAMRKGRFYVARYYVREMIEKTANLLHCRKLLDEEMPQKIKLPKAAMWGFLEKQDKRKKEGLVTFKVLRPFLLPPSESKQSFRLRRVRA